MKVEYIGSLGICIQKSFENNDGELIEYFEAYFVNDEENEVVRLTTKQDLRPLVGHSGVATIDMQDNGKKKLVSFNTPNSSTKE